MEDDRDGKMGALDRRISSLNKDFFERKNGFFLRDQKHPENSIPMETSENEPNYHSNTYSNSYYHYPTSSSKPSYSNHYDSPSNYGNYPHYSSQSMKDYHSYSNYYGRPPPQYHSRLGSPPQGYNYPPPYPHPNSTYDYDPRRTYVPPRNYSNNNNAPPKKRTSIQTYYPPFTKDDSKPITSPPYSMKSPHHTPPSIPNNYYNTPYSPNNIPLDSHLSSPPPSSHSRIEHQSKKTHEKANFIHKNEILHVPIEPSHVVSRLHQQSLLQTWVDQIVNNLKAEEVNHYFVSKFNLILFLKIKEEEIKKQIEVAVNTSSVLSKEASRSGGHLLSKFVLRSNLKNDKK